MEIWHGGGARCTRWPRMVLVLGEVGIRKSDSEFMSMVVEVSYKVRELHLILG